MSTRCVVPTTRKTIKEKKRKETEKEEEKKKQTKRDTYYIYYIIIIIVIIIENKIESRRIKKKNQTPRVRHVVCRSSRARGGYGKRKENEKKKQV